jgi:type VI secretion system secreted protein VgrG
MDAGFTQKNRRIAVEDNPLGKDVLLLTSLSGKEEISEPFNFQLEMLSGRENISSKEIVGKKVTFRVSYGGEEPRYFNGYVSKFAASSLMAQGMRLYKAEVVPWLWFLTRTADCRIFQNKTVPQIIEQLFSDHGEIKDYEITEVKGTHPKREYCVQYRETDFDFISRLMEEEGIFYWFRHTENSHTLVLADQKGAYKDLPDKEVEYVGGTDETLVQGQLHAWERRHEFQPGKWVQTDYNFKTPGTKLHTSTQTVVEQPDMKKYEIFDYPGRYSDSQDGEQLTKLRMEETELNCDRITAGGSYCRFTPGGKFTVKRHECSSEEGKCYLVTSVSHQADDQTYLGGQEQSERYSNEFTCIPADVVFRPTRKTRKPVVQGPQTAVVVGPKGEEIHTDEYGRVKVQFHWDRYGKMDENSSCFVRVSHPWAGKNWGMVAIPRMGQEVLVDFLEGDPDKPIITGRVYNAEQMPPYGLPANATQTGILTRSSKGGSGANANEIRFEDKKGSEQLYIHAEKNQDISVENDETHSVGRDRTKTVDHDETTHVKNDRTETVGNNEKIAIIQNRTETVGGDETITVSKNRSRTVILNENIKVLLTRTRFVGVNDLITVIAAQEIGVGGYRLVAVGAYQDVKIGGYLKEKIGANRTEDVGANRTSTVTANDSLTVKGGQTVSITKDQGTTIKGGQTVAVTKDQGVKVDGGRSATIGKDDSLNVKNNLVIDAGDSVTIKTGDASISMKKDGTIVIKGKNITVQGSSNINVKADSNIVMKASKISEN